MTKKVTVCVQSYNHGDYIEKCLRSIIHQDYKYKSIMVFDDGSSDSSIAIIKRFENQFKNIQLIKTKTPLNNSNFNKIMMNCGKFGDYFTVFHSDDMYKKNILSTQVKFMEKNKNILAAGTSADLINEKSKKIGIANLPIELNRLSTINHMKFTDLLFSFGFFLMTPSFIYRTEFFQKKKIYYDYSKFGWASDVGFLAYLTRYGEIGFINKKLMSYRISNVSTSQILIKTKIYRSDIFKVLKYLLNNKKLDVKYKKKLIIKMKFMLMYDITLCNINRAIQNLPLLKNKFTLCAFEGLRNVNNFKKLIFIFLIKILIFLPKKNRIFNKILKLKHQI